MRVLRAIAFGATTILVAVGCEPSGSNQSVAGTAQVAYTRFVNAVQDTGSLDFAFVDAVVLSPRQLAVPYRSFSSYQATAPGSRTVKAFYDSVNATGSYATQTIQIDSLTASFTAGTYYTIILNGPSVGTKQSWIILTDNTTAFDTTWTSIVGGTEGTAAGNVALRIVNLDAGNNVTLNTYTDTGTVVAGVAKTTVSTGTPFPTLGAAAAAPITASATLAYTQPALATSTFLFDTVTSLGAQQSWARFAGTGFVSYYAALPQGVAVDALDNLTAIGGLLQGGSVISVFAWAPATIGTSAFCAGTAPGVGPATCSKSQIATFQNHGITFVVDHHPSPAF